MTGRSPDGGHRTVRGARHPRQPFNKLVQRGLKFPTRMSLAHWATIQFNYQIARRNRAPMPGASGCRATQCKTRPVRSFCLWTCQQYLQAGTEARASDKERLSNHAAGQFADGYFELHDRNAVEDQIPEDLIDKTKAEMRVVVGGSANAKETCYTQAEQATVSAAEVPL